MWCINLSRQYRLLPMFLLVAVTLPVSAIELTSTYDEKGLSITAENINYPDELLKKKLKSGLTNDISFMLSIKLQERVVFAKQLNFQITYDLWDEVYLVNTSLDGSVIERRTLESPEALQQKLRKITVRHLKTSHPPSPGEIYHISGRVLVNPVETERINKIKGWIANTLGHKLDGKGNGNTVLSANSTPRAGPVSATGADASRIINQGTRGETLGSARPRFQKLFDKILEQYITRDEIPALWSSETVTFDFQIGAIKKGDKTP